MSTSIADILKQMLLHGAVARMRQPAMRETIIAWLMMGLGGCAVLLSLIYFSVAAYGGLEQTYSQPIAAAIIGAFAATVALGLVWGGFKTLSKREQVAEKRSEEELIKTVDILMEELTEELKEPIQANPLTAVAMAAVAGFMADRKMH